jgi:hypothetical protein
MTYNKMVELVKKLQNEGERCKICQLELYLTQRGELRKQLVAGNHEYGEGFFHLMTFQGKDTRNPELLINCIETPDGFPKTKDWYMEADF